MMVLSLPSVSSSVNFPLTDSIRDHFGYTSLSMQEGLPAIEAAVFISRFIPYIQSPVIIAHIHYKKL